MIFGIIFVIIFISILILFTSVFIVFAFKKDNYDIPNTKFNDKITPKSCLAFNPTDESSCYTGVVSKNDSIDLTDGNLQNLKMSVLFGEKNKDSDKWNSIETLKPHNGCQKNDVLNSPFIINCDNQEQGQSLINDFYNSFDIHT
jgi:hypothetical protein